MKIMKIISDCIQCDYLYSDGITKESGILCSIAKNIDGKIPEIGIPNWCPLEDYEMKK